jgi:hypothetical protein
MSYTQKNKIRYEQIYQITGKQKALEEAGETEPEQITFQVVTGRKERNVTLPWVRSQQVCGLLGSNPRQRYIPFLSPCHDLKGNLLRLCFPIVIEW